MKTSKKIIIHSNMRSQTKEKEYNCALYNVNTGYKNTTKNKILFSPPLVKKSSRF